MISHWMTFQCDPQAQSRVQRMRHQTQRWRCALLYRHIYIYISHLCIYTSHLCIHTYLIYLYIWRCALLYCHIYTYISHTCIYIYLYIYTDLMSNAFPVVPTSSIKSAAHEASNATLQMRTTVSSHIHIHLSYVCIHISRRSVHIYQFHVTRLFSVTYKLNQECSAWGIERNVENAH